MVAGKVKHWKHGWIPVSPEAKAFVAGTGPKPVTNDGRKFTAVQNYSSMSNADKINAAARMFGFGSKQHREAMRRFHEAAPNAALGLPGQTAIRGNPRAAQRRASDIADLVPGLPGGPPQPHYQFASQGMDSRYTGGVVFSPAQADFLLDFLQANHEGTVNDDDLLRLQGHLPVNRTKGTPEEVAKRRARRLSSLLGGEASAAPHYDIPAGATAGEGKGHFTGGIYLRADETDALIKALVKRRTGPPLDIDMARITGRPRR